MPTATTTVDRRRRAVRALVALGALTLALPLMLSPCTRTRDDRLPSGYRLVFEDDFDGTGLDAAVWQTAPFGGSLPAVVADGVLTLRTTAANGRRWGHVASTGPRSPGEPSYPGMRAWQGGLFEARLRYTDDRWAWPAFWLFSAAKTEAWRPDGAGEDCPPDGGLNAEWDIVENGVDNGDGDRPASSWYATFLHENTTDNTPDGYCGRADRQRAHRLHFPNVDLADWHDWAAHWTPDHLCTFLDGVLIQCTEPFASTAQPMHLVFTMQYLGRCAGCPPRPDELVLQVDHVRVWQPEPGPD
ncbi:MAG TPA: hypothetical protein VK306_00425 [Acidimicrobiales bacterium]|nr:hypothetical protein [Acidimicrobiales bacterium]